MKELRDWARALKRETLSLYYATHDPRTSWYAKLLAGLIVAYALSPIGLVPDFIPVLGLLDELILLPLGIWLVLRLIPDAVLSDARRRAEHAAEQPTSRSAAVVIIAIWVGVAALSGVWLYRILDGPG